ncbi:MAG: hypothetical protein AAGB00_08720 [Planctomycetota bacterium]
MRTINCTITKIAEASRAAGLQNIVRMVVTPASVSARGLSARFGGGYLLRASVPAPLPAASEPAWPAMHGDMHGLLDAIKQGLGVDLGLGRLGRLANRCLVDGCRAAGGSWAVGCSRHKAGQPGLASIG